jgi:hypothetical protein
LGPRPIAGARPIAETDCAGLDLLRVGLLESAARIRRKPDVRLNMATRPIANKYREGKLQRTLKREFKRA